MNRFTQAIKPLDAAELARRFPWIPWRKPVLARALDASAKGLTCRICVALHGLKAHDIPALPQTLAEFEQHMQEQHPL